MDKTVVKSIEDAMDLLKGAGAPEKLEAKPAETAPVVEPPVVDTQKSETVDFQKAEDSQELEEFIKADEFMLGLAKNQDANTLTIVKAITANIDASKKMIDVVKSFGERLDMLGGVVAKLAQAPLPRRAVLSKSDMDELNKVVATSPKEENKMLAKSDIVNALSDGVAQSVCTSKDVIRAEAGLSGMVSDAELRNFLNNLSAGGGKIVKGLLSAS
jgi:hypothetical protein